MRHINLDVLFVHPPASINGASHTLDADVGYTGQFVALPMGFFNMSDKLDNAGYKVRILNLGERVYANGVLPVSQHIENIISTYRPKVIGMDIHWMIHAAGAIECARMIKEYSPDTRVVLGGISASFFAKEILEKYPQVDYVMVGECDESIIDLIREISDKNPELEKVPNLAYRSENGIRMSDVIVPDISEDIDLTRYDLLIDEPIVNPDRAVISFFRGCYKNCCFCTGGNESFNYVMKRKKLGIIKPHVLVGLMRKNWEKGRDKIYLYGDIRFCGDDYVDRFFKGLYESNITGARVVFEFFELATEDYVKQWSKWARETGNSLEATHSPESGNVEVRRQFGKGYSNEQLLEHCNLLVDHKIPHSIYFLLGLPGQTRETVEETLRLSDEIVRIFARGFKRSDLRHEIVSFNFMQIPDAGSCVFRDPEKFGYHFDSTGIEALIDNLLHAHHWSETVNYHIDTLSKSDLIHLFYHIQKSLFRIYHKYQMISDQELQEEIDKYVRDEEKVARKLRMG